MQKQQLHLTLISFLTLLIFTGCDRNTDASPKTKTQLLAQASWKVRSDSAAGADIANTPAIVSVKDDVVNFSANGCGTVTEGTVVCNPTTAGNITWNFQDSETKLMMSSGLFPAGSGLFTIVTLNETTLTLSQDVTIPPSPIPVPVSATYVH